MLYDNTLYLNLLGGPGSAKSTIGAGIFSLLKLHGVDCELVQEFAKELTWENNLDTLQNQFYVSAVQYERLLKLKNKVEVVVIDSSLLNGVAYTPPDLPNTFDDLVVNLFNSFDNFNVLLNRNINFGYNDNGRNQNISEAVKVDAKIKILLDKYRIKYIERVSSYETINIITQIILLKINKQRDGLKYEIEEIL